MESLIAAQDIRDYANFPSEVPERLIETHIAYAHRNLSHDLSREIGGEIELSEQIKSLLKDAQLFLTLASLLPQLHTFALDGAAKVGRLEGSVEFRFLTPDDVSSYVDDYRKKAQNMILQAKAAMARKTNDDKAKNQSPPPYIIGSL